MKIAILEEHGTMCAIRGITLSHGASMARAFQIAPKLAQKDYGHNKFLESIMIWVEIVAPRYWWQQADTYRLGISKQSESTMHTIMKHDLTSSDFEGDVPQQWIDTMNNWIRAKEFSAVKAALPESFLQKRIVCLNYKCLRNMLLQRHNHRLQEWRIFCKYMLEHVQHPEFLPHLDIEV